MVSSGLEAVQAGAESGGDRGEVGVEIGEDGRDLLEMRIGRTRTVLSAPELRHASETIRPA